jgi:hypothetical protein
LIELPGVTVHDPDVVFTDLGLALLGGWLGWRLWRGPDRDRFRSAGAVILAGLASAALWGAVFHAFFPGNTTTLPGFIAWIPVPLSIAVASAALMYLALAILAPRVSPATRRLLVGMYALAFAAVVLVVDESFGTIVRFYAPALVLFLLAAAREAIRLRSTGWTLIAVSFVISGVAAVLQQARLSLHPEYFDHNAVYHVFQALGLLVLYAGFQRVARAPGRGYPAVNQQALRPE